ncbi:GTPase HflX [Undibacterium cyanobacteriorum]|uniref:GTPase HflX n=1 Tax=Undibacterium cyanobacteriorum TaxID=3073561 RepID=A0ABY9RM58_9BURK|nr:GTPase HflX [Undibacterium sp. 20NA77.5]WMW82295.1 GTPase HflX [Undibacterium sp. 20NA77.5]
MRAALVGVDFGKGDFAASLDELSQLALTAGAETITTISCKRLSPDAALFVGSGKADEISDAVGDLKLDIVIFNHALSPAQQRNLERHLKVRVIDRTSLILDIFAQRAKSHEGKVQVELAQLQHLATRLVRGWTHLERQKGGIGLRGPGETQLETDRRLLGERVKMLKAKMAKLHKQRETQRRSRGRNKTFSVSLVGYTNAGKSTLFNTLTKAGTYAANQLFATLDTTSRRLYLEGAGNIVVSDTVGFIRDLPHQLVASFRATLEETIHADLLLHVVDAGSAVRADQIEQVNLVLKEIGADHIPQLLVWNKIDQTTLEPGFERDEYGKIARVFVSAKTGAGLDVLRAAIVELMQDFQQKDLETDEGSPDLLEDSRTLDQ